MCRVRVLVAFASWVFVSVAPAGAQQVLHRFEGDSANDLFGIGTGGGGDVDGDGVPDLIVGAFFDDFAGSDSGSAYVYSGADGSLLHHVSGTAAQDWLGRSVTLLDDLDRDGFAELLVGSSRADANGSNSGSAFVFSGRDASVLHAVHGEAASVYLGWRVASTGDVDGDGIGDFAVSAHDHVTFAQADSVRWYSGADGTLIRRIDGDGSGHTLGTDLANVGDVDLDGVPDLLVGAAFDDRIATDAGSARIYSGQDGSVLTHIDGDRAGDRFGLDLAAVGDLDGDGVAEFVVGANGSDLAGQDAGKAVVYSGSTFQPIYVYRGQNPGDGLGNVSAAGDANGDSVPDFLICASGSESGRADLISGMHGRRMYRYEGSQSGDSLGRTATCVGDVDGDGLDDVLIAAPSSDENGNDAGSAILFAGNDLFLQPAAPTVSAGSTMTLWTRGGAPGVPSALFLTSFDGVPLVFLVGIGALDSAGEWTVSRSVPTSLAGHTLGFTSFAVNPGGWIADSYEASVTVQ